MNALGQPPPNHQCETFDSAQTQFFECEALPTDRPEIQARERAPFNDCNSRLQLRGKRGPHRRRINLLRF